MVSGSCDACLDIRTSLLLGVEKNVVVLVRAPCEDDGTLLLNVVSLPSSKWEANRACVVARKMK